MSTQALSAPISSLSFWTTFWISFIFGTIVGPDLKITWSDFGPFLSWPWPLNLLYLSQKWSDCHETKSKHIDWTWVLKCDQWVWPWPWTWPWIFKVKYGICYISAKNGPDCHETKSIYIDWNLGLKCDQWVGPWTWPSFFNFQGKMWPWSLATHMALTMDFIVKFGNSCISEWEGWLTLNIWGGNRSFMTVTIWWLRSGVRIYRIVTGVTSDVGVPSTHLVNQLGPGDT